MTTLAIFAHDYEHDLVGDFSQEQLDAINGAAYCYILAGDNAAIETFVRTALIADQIAVESEAGEILLFTYEELEDKQYDLLVELNVTYYLEDRS